MTILASGTSSNLTVEFRTESNFSKDRVGTNSNRFNPGTSRILSGFTFGKQPEIMSLAFLEIFFATCLNAMIESSSYRPTALQVVTITRSAAEILLVNDQPFFVR